MYILTTLLLGATGLASALSGQCNNVISSASCYQSANYGSAFSGPYSIFNVANIGYGQSYNLASTSTLGYYGNVGFSRRIQRNTCLRVNALPIQLRSALCDQPIYTRIVTSTPLYKTVDNVCTTLFPLPDSPDTFVLYRSVVFCDGSNQIQTYIAEDSGPGTLRKARPYSTITQRMFAQLGNDVVIGCSRAEYDNYYGDDIFVTSTDLRPIGANCVQQIQQIVQCNGLDNTGLYVLPYRLPPRCVTQQVCALQNPLLSYGATPVVGFTPANRFY